MDRKIFGRTIAAVRKRTFDQLTLQPLTQAELAQRMGCSLRMVQNLEQGLIKHIDPDMLVTLAEALYLTTLERIVLFALVSEVRRADLMRLTQPPEQILQQEYERLAPKQLPSILYDPFYHVLAVNHTGMAFCDVTEAKLDTLLQRNGYIDFLYFVFHPQSPLRVLFHETWERFAKFTLHHYRVVTLPYRYTDYFQRRFGELSKYKDFLHYWIETQGEKEDFRTQSKTYNYRHSQLGLLHYETKVSEINTAYGKLYRSTLHPLNDETAATFSRLYKQVGPGLKRLTPWPHSSLFPKTGGGGGTKLEHSLQPR